MLTPPLGVVLAGGEARRLPGKPLLRVGGRPMISYPLDALREVLEEVVVVAKAPVGDLTTWIEPARPVHPVCGIRHALAQAGGRGVLVCAADMPSIDAAELQAILAARLPGTRLAVIPRAGGRLQPLCALYEDGSLEVLRSAEPEESMRLIAQRLHPHVIDREAEPYANVNTRAQLAERE